MDFWIVKNSVAFRVAVKDPTFRTLGRNNRICRTTSAKRETVTFLNFFLNYNYILMYRVLKTKYKKSKSTVTVPEKQTFANNQQRQLEAMI